MRPFDSALTVWCSKHDASYRRYSDDIAVVVPNSSPAINAETVVSDMLKKFGLATSTGKTEIAVFRSGQLVSAKPIQYLGFTYDGQRKLIRPSSIDAYRSKMETHIHAKLVAAKAQEIPSFEAFRRELMSMYTHRGKRRNFPRYAYRSAKVLNSPDILQQVKRHVTWFERAWERQVTEVYGGLIIR